MSDAVASELFRGELTSIKRYVDLLSMAGVERGLIGPREVDRIWDRHIFNSVALADLIPLGADVADMGSGAGLPGVPLAIHRPDLQMTLIEPLLRRATFLTEVIDELGLGARVTVLRARAEDVRATYEIVVARAVAPLGKLLVWSGPLLAEAGVLLAMKGARAEAEVEAAAVSLRSARLVADVLEVRAHADVAPTRVVRVRRY